MRFELDDEPEVDFLLIGICSKVKDYTMCWELNRTLGFDLQRERTTPEVAQSRNNPNSQHHWYYYYDENTHSAYNLLNNKGKGGMILPEQSQVDFLLVVKNNLNVNLTELINRIRNIEVVLTAFEIDAEAQRSIENLIYLDLEKD